MGNIDNSKKTFSAFIKKYEDYKKNDLSESDTRSKILDTILITVLHWDESNIQREGHTEEGFYDYRLSLPNFNLIIEAKKDFLNLKLPDRHHKVKAGTLLAGNNEVITQIQKYLLGEGVQYGIITNGHQFIIGKFINTDGSKWKDNVCILFNGFDDIEKRFIEFYNLLSRDAVSNNSVSNSLSYEKIEGRTIFSTLGNKQHKELIRNDLTANLTPILSEIFGEIYKFETLDSKELLKECFIKNEETKKNKSEIERLLDDKPPELGEVIPVVNTDNTIKYIKDTITNNPAQRETPPPDPIIIIGSKGSGKTTFINYLFEVTLDNSILQDRPFIIIDFRKYDDLTYEKNEIYKDLIEGIYNHYPDLKIFDLTVLKRTYYKEIHQRDIGIWKFNKETNPEKYEEQISTFLETSIQDAQDHFIKFSEYLIRERRKRLTIVIDNADQKGPLFQKETYLFAAGLNRLAKCSVIISLREGYYYRWRNKPPFDAFQSVVYHISAPPYSEVLESRIDYAIKKIDFIKATSGHIRDKSVVITSETIKNFFLNLDKTLFANDNSEMLNYLELTSFPNIREGLESFKQFLLSGHTNVHKYVINLETTIPIWEFVKSISLYNNLYYNHELSEIKNLFFPAENNTNHFTKIRILRFLYNTTKKHGFREKFVPCSDLITLFQKIGYTEDIIINELELLIEYRMVDTDDNLSDIESTETDCTSHDFCLSLKGFHYLDEMINRFHYLNLVLQDTPIYSPDFFHKIHASFPYSDEYGYQVLSKRIETVKLFFEYLESQEMKETIKTGLDDSLYYSICEEIKAKGLLKDITRIEKAVKIYG